MKDWDSQVEGIIIHLEDNRNTSVNVSVPTVWSKEEVLAITKLFDGMYSVMWEYSHRQMVFMTIEEKESLYDTTKIKCFMRFLKFIKGKGYTFSFDNNIGKMIEEVNTGDLHRAIDWEVTLTHAVKEQKLPKIMTFYITKELPDGE